MRSSINLLIDKVGSFLVRKFTPGLILSTISVGSFGCVSTFPMHDPIYPAGGESITYTLEAESNGGIAEVRLYELVSSIDAAGNMSAGTEMLLRKWDIPSSPTSASVSYTKTGGYPPNKLIRYRFEVIYGKHWWGCWGWRQSHRVTFAIRPYPVTDQPAPVFVQGDIDHTFDLVFIPDKDILNMEEFRDNCKGMIEDAVLAEPCIRPWSSQFNFYINPEAGVATDYDKIGTDKEHQRPSNWAYLSFAEAKAIMHTRELRDYADMVNGLFSTEQHNRGDMMHEIGHAMFGLADEYIGGDYFQADILPNNWSTRAEAEADAPSRHKTAADVRQIEPQIGPLPEFEDWYKICDDDCQMKNSGLNPTNYDEPCTDRVVYSIFDNARNP